MLGAKVASCSFRTSDTPRSIIIFILIFFTKATYLPSYRPIEAAAMSKKITSVNDTAHLSRLLSQTSYSIIDFYADWCGPCKTIAPVFNALAEKESKPGKLQFLKVDVDACQDVARKYNVSA